MNEAVTDNTTNRDCVRMLLIDLETLNISTNSAKELIGLLASMEGQVAASLLTVWESMSRNLDRYNEIHSKLHAALVTSKAHDLTN